MLYLSCPLLLLCSSVYLTGLCKWIRQTNRWCMKPDHVNVSRWPDKLRPNNKQERGKLTPLPTVPLSLQQPSLPVAYLHTPLTLTLYTHSVHSTDSLKDISAQYIHRKSRRILNFIRNLLQSEQLSLSALSYIVALHLCLALCLWIDTPKDDFHTAWIAVAPFLCEFSVRASCCLFFPDLT